MKLQLQQELSTESIAGENKKIKLVVTDVEGCLNLDERTYDYDALTRIRLANQLARPDNVVPFITVCSGRQHAFVEAIIRMIAGRMPAIFENGCGLFFPTRELYYEYEWHPSLNQSHVGSNCATVREIMTDICERTGARRVIGKEWLFSLHPARSMSVEQLRQIVDRILDERGIAASVSNSASAVDIAPIGIDKGSGLQWLISKLSQEFPLELSNVAGIGDSKGDLSFLRLVGFPAAPSNATEEVKAVAKYCSPLPDGQGVVDIVQQCIAINMNSR